MNKNCSPESSLGIGKMQKEINAEIPEQGTREDACVSFEPFEPFERSYLDALANEGIDLSRFLAAWRETVISDLERLAELSRKNEFVPLRGVLHRLSGAVGLVGALSLIEALRRAGTLPLEHSAASVVELAQRLRTLVAQLDTLIESYPPNP